MPIRIIVVIDKFLTISTLNIFSNPQSKPPTPSSAFPLLLNEHCDKCACLCHPPHISAISNNSITFSNAILTHRATI